MDKFQEEFTDYMDLGFTPVLTEDGSYSLRQNQLDEDMHSKGGALTETEYIYYNPLEGFIKNHSVKSTQVISVGLGFGYNEILTAILALRLGLKIKVLSFEKEDSLIKLFQKRLSSPSSYPEYFKIFKKYEFSIEDVCDFLTQNCQFNSSLARSSILSMEPASKAILFDAYSNKTSAELWSESFLNSFLQEATLAPSMLTTYASTGSLNRALKQSGFIKVNKRKGFGYKRESTLAFKL